MMHFSFQRRLFSEGEHRLLGRGERPSGNNEARDLRNELKQLRNEVKNKDRGNEELKKQLDVQAEQIKRLREIIDAQKNGAYPVRGPNGRPEFPSLNNQNRLQSAQATQFERQMTHPDAVEHRMDSYFNRVTRKTSARYNEEQYRYSKMPYDGKKRMRYGSGRGEYVEMFDRNAVGPDGKKGAWIETDDTVGINGKPLRSSVDVQTEGAIAGAAHDAAFNRSFGPMSREQREHIGRRMDPIYNQQLRSRASFERTMGPAFVNNMVRGPVSESDILFNQHRNRLTRQGREFSTNRTFENITVSNTTPLQRTPIESLSVPRIAKVFKSPESTDAYSNPPEVGYNEYAKGIQKDFEKRIADLPQKLKGTKYEKFAQEMKTYIDGELAAWANRVGDGDKNDPEQPARRTRTIDRFRKIDRSIQQLETAAAERGGSVLASVDPQTEGQNFPRGKQESQVARKAQRLINSIPYDYEKYSKDSNLATIGHDIAQIQAYHNELLEDWSYYSPKERYFRAQRLRDMREKLNNVTRQHSAMDSRIDELKYRTVLHTAEVPVAPLKGPTNTQYDVRIMIPHHLMEFAGGKDREVWYNPHNHSFRKGDLGPALEAGIVMEPVLAGNKNGLGREDVQGVRVHFTKPGEYTLNGKDLDIH
jgi:hypothetical protein